MVVKNDGVAWMDKRKQIEQQIEQLRQEYDELDQQFEASRSTCYCSCYLADNECTCDEGAEAAEYLFDLRSLKSRIRSLEKQLERITLVLK